MKYMDSAAASILLCKYTYPETYGKREGEDVSKMKTTIGQVFLFAEAFNSVNDGHKLPTCVKTKIEEYLVSLFGDGISHIEFSFSYRAGCRECDCSPGWNVRANLTEEARSRFPGGEEMLMSTRTERDLIMFDVDKTRIRVLKLDLNEKPEELCLIPY